MNRLFWCGMMRSADGKVDPRCTQRDKTLSRFSHANTERTRCIVARTTRYGHLRNTERVRCFCAERAAVLAAFNKAWHVRAVQPSDGQQIVVPITKCGVKPKRACCIGHFGYERPR